MLVSICSFQINVDFGLDAKFRFDDNAEYRQKELFKYRDFSQEDPKEVAATKFDLNYIALDGAIGMSVIVTFVHFFRIEKI